MSFQHRHHHSHHHSHSSSSCCPNNSSCGFTCCCCSNKSPDSAVTDHYPSHSSSPDSDQLLRAALLIIQSHTQPHPPIFLNPQPQPLRTAHKPRSHHQYPHQHQKDDAYNDDPSSLLLHSLTRRVSALESSLSSFSSQKQQQSPSQTKQQQRRQSLKHLAAATIQRCFRRYLARRSRTLRDLKHLASIKSHAASLRFSLSSSGDGSLSNPRSLSRKAMDLLFQLDSIQSSDPMIREGKRSVRKELMRISEYVDKILIREKEDDGAGELEKRRERGGRKVSFAETNGVDACKVFDDMSEIIFEEEEARTHVRRGGGEMESPRVVNGDFRGSNGGLGLAAPLPVKMEPRRNGFVKKVTHEEED